MMIPLHPLQILAFAEISAEYSILNQVVNHMHQDLVNMSVYNNCIVVFDTFHNFIQSTNHFHTPF